MNSSSILRFALPVAAPYLLRMALASSARAACVILVFRLPPKCRRHQHAGKVVKVLVANSPNRAQLPGAVLVGDAARLDFDLFAEWVRAVVARRRFVGQL